MSLHTRPSVSEGKREDARQDAGVLAASLAGEAAPKLAFILQRIFIAYVMFATVAAVFVAPFITYACKRAYVDFDWLFLVIAAVAGVAFAIVGAKLRGHAAALKAFVDQHFNAIVAIGSLALFTAQLVLIHFTFFKTGWDVGGLYDRARGAVDSTDYLAFYPNQAFIYAMFVAARKVSELLGMTDFYLLLVVAGAICVAVSIMLLTHVARRVGGCALAIGFFVFASVYLGLSPWIDVPYSDAYGTLCPSIVLFGYACIKKQPIKLFVITLFGVLGYFIKPTAIFALAAIVIVELISWVKRMRSGDAASPLSSLRKTMMSLLSVVLGTAIALSLGALAKVAMPDVDEGRAFSMTHYLMMGANPDTMGIYSDDDVALSSSITDPAERQQRNVEVWLERINEAGPVGTGKLLVRKTLSNYADGTFSWGMEGEAANRFFVDAPHRDGLLGKYFVQTKGATSPYLYISQTIWMFVLLGICLLWLKKRPSNIECAMCIALLMLSAFLLVFECRARYLFLYSPYFVMLALLGWQEVRRRMSAMRERERSPEASR